MDITLQQKSLRRTSQKSFKTTLIHCLRFDFQYLFCITKSQKLIINNLKLQVLVISSTVFTKKYNRVYEFGFAYIAQFLFYVPHHLCDFSNTFNWIKQVSFVKIVPEFPRTASNKLLRRVLRDQIKSEFSVRSRI